MYNNYVIGPGKTQSCVTDHIEIADFFNVTLIWFLSTGVPTIKGLATNNAEFNEHSSTIHRNGILATFKPIAIATKILV